MSKSTKNKISLGVLFAIGFLAGLVIMYRISSAALPEADASTRSLESAASVARPTPFASTVDAPQPK